MRIALLEAAVSGLSIVAVNAACVAELVHDRINGFLIDSNNTNGFSRTLTSRVYLETIKQTRA